MIFRRKLTVYRYEGGEWVSGEWQRGYLRRFPIFASVQPTGASNTAMEEAGSDTVRQVLLFTSTELFPDRIPDQEADEVEIDGVHYKVIRADAWQNGILPHYEVLAEEVR